MILPNSAPKVALATIVKKRSKPYVTLEGHKKTKE